MSLEAFHLSVANSLDIIEKVGFTKAVFGMTVYLQILEKLVSTYFHEWIFQRQFCSFITSFNHSVYIYNTFLVLAKKAVMFLKHINQYMKFKERKH